MQSAIVADTGSNALRRVYWRGERFGEVETLISFSYDYKCPDGAPPRTVAVDDDEDDDDDDADDGDDADDDDDVDDDDDDDRRDRRDRAAAAAPAAAASALLSSAITTPFDDFSEAKAVLLLVGMVLASCGCFLVITSWRADLLDEAEWGSVAGQPAAAGGGGDHIGDCYDDYDDVDEPVTSSVALCRRGCAGRGCLACAGPCCGRGERRGGGRSRGGSGGAGAPVRAPQQPFDDEYCYEESGGLASARPPLMQHRTTEQRSCAASRSDTTRNDDDADDCAVPTVPAVASQGGPGGSLRLVPSDEPPDLLKC